MKHITAMLLLCLWAGTATRSFAGVNGPFDPMEKGSWSINFGFGPGTNWQGVYGRGFIPAFQVAVETGMWEVGPGVITMGGEIGCSFFTYKGTDARYGPNTTYKYRYSELVVAARGAYHYGWNVQGLDTYAGVAAGPRFVFFSYSIPDTWTGPVNDKPATVGYGGGVFAGASYFFTELLGINAELGFNITYAQLGMVFKIK